MTGRRCIVVTGAGGYIGTSLVPYLLESGYDVRAIDRYFFGDQWLPQNEYLTLVKEDIRNLNTSHFNDAYGCIDLAAISNDPTGEKYAKETFDINHKARSNNAVLAEEAGVERYILPSSCSNYGRIPDDEIADEKYELNPLSNYSKANANAEKDVLSLAKDKFCVTVLRQGTVFGVSPKMRFDLAINGMTHSAWVNKKLPLMRPGTQRRPMLHVKDAIRAQRLMLEIDPAKINGEIFNVGGGSNNYSVNDLAEIFKELFGDDLAIEWYGTDDDRSYFVSFDKIHSIGFEARYTARDGIVEVLSALEAGSISKGEETITLDWYEKLEYWQRKIHSMELDGKLLKLSE